MLERIKQKQSLAQDPQDPQVPPPICPITALLDLAVSQKGVRLRTIPSGVKGKEGKQQ